MITAVVSAITALLVVILTNGLGRLLETRRRHDKVPESYAERQNRDLTTKRGRQGLRQVQSHNLDDGAAHG